MYGAVYYIVCIISLLDQKLNHNQPKKINIQKMAIAIWEKKRERAQKKNSFKYSVGRHFNVFIFVSFSWWHNGNMQHEQMSTKMNGWTIRWTANRCVYIRSALNWRLSNDRVGFGSHLINTCTPHFWQQRKQNVATAVIMKYTLAVYWIQDNLVNWVLLMIFSATNNHASKHV